MISTKLLEQKINELIDAGNLTDLQITQLSGAVQSLENSSFLSVASFSDLPDVELNLGRLVYVVDEEKFYFSDGQAWADDFSTDSTIISATAYAWGSGSFGALGDGTQTAELSPVTLLGNITNWSQIASGSSFSLGFTDEGILYAWGGNNSGNLGDGTTTNRSSPVTVLGNITNWSQVSAGGIHSLGVTDDGIAYAWGSNSNGRLGIAEFAGTRSSPVTVAGSITNWSQVSAGNVHSLGVTDDGIAYAWGFNFYAQLGDGTTFGRNSPVTVVGNITNWSQVSAGSNHSLGVTDDGIAYAWGRNNTGKLGDGTTTARSSPVTVVGGITNWSQVSAGSNHSLGVTDDSIAYAWGSNDPGRLGNDDDTATSKSSPVTVVGGITNWSQVSAGGIHSLGLTDDGIAYAWGGNTAGRLGDGTTENRSSPVTVIGGITNWSQVSAGSAQSFGLEAQTKGFEEA